MDCSPPGFLLLHYLPEFCSNSCPLSQWWMPSNRLILCCPLLLLPSICPSIRVFSNESVIHIWWPKYWSFSISPSNDYSGLIYFRIDWFDLLAVQGTLKSLLQHHNSETSILQHSAFFRVQLSHPYMTTGKTVALTIQTPCSGPRERAKKSIHGPLLILPSAILPLSVEEIGSRARSSETDTGRYTLARVIPWRDNLLWENLISFFYFAHTFHILLHFIV